jgi:hypothetical protein
VTAAGPVPWTLCVCCRQPIMVLVTPVGVPVEVDPYPQPGGPLIVNGAAGRIIGRHEPRSANTGWWPHRSVCPQQHTDPRLILRGEPLRGRAVVRA